MTKNQYESKTLFELLNERDKLYPTEIDFIDEPLEGGFKMGQVVAIVGEYEKGKELLLNQILCNMANKDNKCLYFSSYYDAIIFEYLEYKFKNNFIKEKSLKNIYIYNIFTDYIEHSKISEIIKEIELFAEQKEVKVIVIDNIEGINAFCHSQEENILKAIRRLHQLAIKNNILIFLHIEPSFINGIIFDFLDILIHINYNDNEGKGKLSFFKNTQAFRNNTFNLDFNKDTLSFTATNNRNKTLTLEDL